METFDVLKPVLPKVRGRDASASGTEDHAGTSAESTSAQERALAVGVLHQAEADLRRFRDADDRVGREMYADACGWFIDGDTAWPYSFLNVCRTLRLSPEAAFDDAFADAGARWYSHSRRTAGRVAKSIKVSLSSVFSARRTPMLALAKS